MLSFVPPKLPLRTEATRNQGFVFPRPGLSSLEVLPLWPGEEPLGKRAASPSSGCSHSLVWSSSSEQPQPQFCSLLGPLPPFRACPLAGLWALVLSSPVTWGDLFPSPGLISACSIHNGGNLMPVLPPPCWCQGSEEDVSGGCEPQGISAVARTFWAFPLSQSS